MDRPYSAIARTQPSEHPRWCIVEEAHSREDCIDQTEHDERMRRYRDDRAARPAQYRPIE